VIDINPSTPLRGRTPARDNFEYQENRRGKVDARTFLSIGGDILVVVGDLVAVPGPGPGWVITFLGLGLIADEFRPVARFMDRAEVRLRVLARWVVGTWTSSFTAAKASTCLGILLCLTTLVYVAYCLFFGGSRGWAPVLSRDAGHVAELHAGCSSVVALRDDTSIDVAHRLI
jgi:uncharacterized protein (TIGR02611 family)